MQYHDESLNATQDSAYTWDVAESTGSGSYTVVTGFQRSPFTVAQRLNEEIL